MVSIPLLPHSSLLFPSIVFHSTEISRGSNCCGRSALFYYKALLYVHDFVLVEIGVWWTMSVWFIFSHPTRPKYRGIKMKKKQKEKKQKQIKTKKEKKKEKKEKEKKIIMIIRQRNKIKQNNV